MGEMAIGAEFLREVRLYGHLGKKFGRIHRVSVRSCREAAQALAATVEGFAKHVLQHGLPGYYVFAGDRTVANNRGERLLDAPLGQDETVFIVPVVAGAKRAGVLQTIVGAVLVVVGAYFGQGWVVQLGVSLMIGGITQMAMQRSRNGETSPANLPSYHFDGPVNNTQQGIAVPVVLGQMIVGSAVISQGISSSELGL